VKASPRELGFQWEANELVVADWMNVGGCCAVHSPRASLSREMIVDRDKLFKRMRGQALEILALVSCIGNTPTRYASRRQLRSLQLPSINIFTEGELRSKVWASAIYKHAQCTPTACASDSLISDFPR